jgi:hypothetical protein
MLLPPLIFEAAFHLDWKQLRRDLPVVLVLASVGVALSAAVTAAGMHYLAHWDWLSCAVFGVLIAATDPVSVIATFREAGARGRLLLLVESEALFNDGTAAVAFAVAITFAGGPPSDRTRGCKLAGRHCRGRPGVRRGGRHLWRCCSPAARRITWWKSLSLPWPPGVPSCWPSISICPACSPPSPPDC